jgi:hypothetical protein
MEEIFPESASWARAVAASIQEVAAIDVDRAIEMAYWSADPAEQLVALAGVAVALDGAAPPLQTILTTFESKLNELPQFVPHVDLTRISQGPILRYLDPTVRARFEAALLMVTENDPYDLLMRSDEDYWYLNEVHRAETVFRGLLDGTYSGIAPDELERQMEDLCESYSRIDDLLKDLLELAGCYALSANDFTRGQARLERIANQSIRARATLLVAQHDPSGVSSKPAEMLKILTDCEAAISPSHRAHLAAIAVQACEASGQDGSALFNWGIKQLEAADPIDVTYGSIALAPVAPPELRPSILSHALASSEQIQNEYMRNDLMANLLAGAVGVTDGALVGRVLDGLFDARWSAFMEGLRRAMPHLVSVAGADIVEKIDASMRRAQAVLGTPPASFGIDHFDGVLAPALREQARRAAFSSADGSLDAYLSTYLNQSDVGPALRWVQDSRVRRADPLDDVFARLHGRRSGLSVWLDEMDCTIWRMVDIRFLFDTAAEATAYHHERLQYNSEGKRPVRQFRSVGQECHVFGGTDKLPVPGGKELSMTAYYYIFRVGRVVAKLFVAQGQEATEWLRPEDVVPLAQRIADKIVAAGLAGE